MPIPVVTQDRIYVDYKQYGIKLQITPVVDGAGTVRAKILTEISDIDDAVAVNGYPGFLMRRVDTEVTVRDGDTIVLSGLIHLSEGKEVSKVPLLGQIPILGELFKSRRFRDRQTQLVVFVTPRIVDPLSGIRRICQTRRVSTTNPKTTWDLAYLTRSIRDVVLSNGTEKGGASTHHQFDKTEISVGRVQGNDIVLPKSNVPRSTCASCLKKAPSSLSMPRAPTALTSTASASMPLMI